MGARSRKSYRRLMDRAADLTRDNPQQTSRSRRRCQLSSKLSRTIRRDRPKVRRSEPRGIPIFERLPASGLRHEWEACAVACGPGHPFDCPRVAKRGMADETRARSQKIAVHPSALNESLGSPGSLTGDILKRARWVRYR